MLNNVNTLQLLLIILFYHLLIISIPPSLATLEDLKLDMNNERNVISGQMIASAYRRKYSALTTRNKGAMVSYSKLL